MNSYKIYQLKFPNNKVYIGQTKRLINERLSEHLNDNRKLTVLKKAIKKYGWSNISVKILKNNLSFKQANYWEKTIIKETKKFNYNMSDGGGHNRYNDKDYRLKLSLSQKGKPRWSDEDKERIRLQRLGTKESDYTKELKRQKSAKVWFYNGQRIKDLFNYCKKEKLSYWTTRRQAKLLA